MAPLLTTSIMNKLANYRIVSRKRQANGRRGTHASQRFGSSLDFSDFRAYEPGDDVRQIDWNVYARTDKLFIKRFLDEQEMRVHIVLDTTPSMNDGDKWLHAQQITALFGQLVLTHDDSLSFSAKQPERLQSFRKKGAMYRHVFQKKVEELQVTQAEEPFFSSLAAQIPKDANSVFIITDGLEALSEFEKTCQHLARRPKDIRFILVSSQEEQEPDYFGDYLLVDKESSESLNVTVTNAMIQRYETTRKNHFEQLEKLAARYGHSLVFVPSQPDFLTAALHQFVRFQWIR
ncbi:DUF58 domain-containing protein [Chryseomicrobium sp. FSL W7-1435]|uniref:DUF58 domain-containing protein n=1 Tax=Chryseomicrobium sp. FSL W7-1435 TaxID=2921704 RepID=UPI00315B25A6